MPMSDHKGDLIERLPRSLAVLLGITLMAFSAHVTQTNQLMFSVGSIFVLMGLNGTRFGWLSIGKESIQIGTRAIESIAKANSSNTISINTSDTMPEALRHEAKSAKERVKTDGLGEVKIVRPDKSLAAGVGNTITASGVTNNSPVVGIGVYGENSGDPDSTLAVLEDGKVYKINYSSP